MSPAPHESNRAIDHSSGSHASDPKILDHAYDGIQEFDNPTPGWWHAIFLATVVFAIFYFAFFHFSPISWSIQDAWTKRQVAEYKKVFGKIGELTGDPATIFKVSTDAQLMPIAQGLFESNCAACHAKDGGGINGVNLTDEHSKNVKNTADIMTVINVGANNGAMPGWQTRLSNNERVILAAYVKNLRGTKPAAPKAPEGEVIPPFSAEK